MRGFGSAAGLRNIELSLKFRDLRFIPGGNDHAMNPPRWHWVDPHGNPVPPELVFSRGTPARARNECLMTNTILVLLGQPNYTPEPKAEEHDPLSQLLRD